MKITEFLEARIAEDEAQAKYVHEYGDTGGAALFSPARVLAECAAKRAILERAMSLGDDGHYAADYMPPREDGTTPDEVGGRRIYPGHPNFTQTVVFSGVLRTLAAVYKDHPDYNQAWALQG